MSKYQVFIHHFNRSDKNEEFDIEHTYPTESVDGKYVLISNRDVLERERASITTLPFTEDMLSPVVVLHTELPWQCYLVTLDRKHSVF